jgi:type IV pilus assembly protein PilA
MKKLKQMKRRINLMKKTNKGFSLVELIIVIAIMAILAAAIAPALIRYIDKSRRADDVTAAGTVLTGVQTAMADED